MLRIIPHPKQNVKGSFSACPGRFFRVGFMDIPALLSLPLDRLIRVESTRSCSRRNGLYHDVKMKSSVRILYLRTVYEDLRALRCLRTYRAESFGFIGIPTPALRRFFSAVFTALRYWVAFLSATTSYPFGNHSTNRCKQHNHTCGHHPLSAARIIPQHKNKSKPNTKTRGCE